MGKVENSGEDEGGEEQPPAGREGGEVISQPRCGED